jgi:hypothetical protein
LESLSFACHVALCNAELSNANCIFGKDKRQRVDGNGKVHEVDKYLDVLAGQKTIAPSVFYDPEDGNPKLIFILDRLGIRIAGTFFLELYIVNLQEYVILTKSF